MGAGRKWRGAWPLSWTSHRHPGSLSLANVLFLPQPCFAPSVGVPACAPELVGLATLGGHLLEPVRRTQGDSRTNAGHQTARPRSQPQPRLQAQSLPRTLASPAASLVPAGCADLPGSCKTKDSRFAQRRRFSVHVDSNLRKNCQAAWSSAQRKGSPSQILTPQT